MNMWRLAFQASWCIMYVTFCTERLKIGIQIICHSTLLLENLEECLTFEEFIKHSLRYICIQAYKNVE
jgi:hypothetical protein